MKIRDVAKAAGVSIATVSRVINHPEQVTDETRDRVQSVIAQNNYVPNGEPKAPRRNRKKNSIAVVVPSLHTYRNVVDGIGAVCAKKNYTFQIYDNRSGEKALLSILKNLIFQQVDGLIISTDLLSQRVQGLIQEERIPYVGIGGEQWKEKINLCYINYRDSAEQVAELLSRDSSGKAVLMLCEEESSCGRQMKEGFESVWHGEITVRHVGASPDEGYLQMQEILADAEHPDVVFTQTDEMAAGVLKAAMDAHVAVPQDMRVAGFDNSPFSAFLIPELTTVEQPTHRLGMLAARMLFDVLEDEGYFDVETQQIVLKGRLKIRQSCGNRKAIYQEYE